MSLVGMGQVVSEMGEVGGSLVGMMSVIVMGVVSSEKEEFIIFGISSNNMSRGMFGEVRLAMVSVMGVVSMMGVVSVVGVVSVMAVVTVVTVVSVMGVVTVMMGVGREGSGVVLVVIDSVVSSENEEFVFFGIIVSNSESGEMTSLVSRVGLVGSVVSSEKEEFIFFSIVSLDGVVTSMSLVGVMSFVMLSGVSLPEQEEFIIFSIVSLDGVVTSMSLVGVMSFVVLTGVSVPE
jgi:hypothetical protein